MQRSDLAQSIYEAPMVDSHEHQPREAAWLDQRWDVLQVLFNPWAYVHADLLVAGLAQADFERAIDMGNPDIAARFAILEPYWRRVCHTGYGEATSLIARKFYDLDELTPAGLAAAQKRHEAEYLQPGVRLHILREEARLDHIQTDDFRMPCEPDPSGPDFFLYDLSVVDFVKGAPDLQALGEEVGATIGDLAGYRSALEALFSKWGPTAIAIKSQHAYQRTLEWLPVEDEAAGPLLQRYLRKDPLQFEEHMALGNWAWGECARLAAEHNLPFKIHTGYMAGEGHMHPRQVRCGNLAELLIKYPQTRFVLMHISWPYESELLGLAKHFRNVWCDMCWAWSINPRAGVEFVRQMIHAVPANKLLVFGGDAFAPMSGWAYAEQTRAGLTRALEAEVGEGWLTEREAEKLARRFMLENQYACFDVTGTRAAIAAMMSARQ